MKSVSQVSDRPYLFMSALRGPDIFIPHITQPLKSLFTARFRGLVFSLEECWADICDRPWKEKDTETLKAVVKEALKIPAYDERKVNALSHFNNHILSAFRSLKKDCVLFPEEYVEEIRVLLQKMQSKLTV